LPVATERIVRDCLAILARRVVPGKLVRLPVVAGPEPKATVGDRGLAALYRGLVDLAGAGPLERDGTMLTFEDRTRLLALVAVVLDSACRSGELAAMRLEDVAVGEVAVRVRRRQQKAPPNRYEEIAALAEVHPNSVKEMVEGRFDRRSEAMRHRVLAAVEELPPLPDEEWYRLREGSRVALRRWLEVREGIVGALPVEGGKSALWVTLTPSKAGPPGVTIRPQGLRQAYARGITALNFCDGRPVRVGADADTLGANPQVAGRAPAGGAARVGVAPATRPPSTLSHRRHLETLRPELDGG